MTPVCVVCARVQRDAYTICALRRCIVACVCIRPVVVGSHVQWSSVNQCSTFGHRVRERTGDATASGWSGSRAYVRAGDELWMNHDICTVHVRL